jgi:DNA polymerase-3 subunit gamma/tau
MIIEMLKKIAADLQVEADAKALFWIARNASGSMRDAESILDQMISYAEEAIKPEDVFFVLGLPGYDVYHKFAGFIAQQDFNSCYTLLDGLMKNGMETGVLISGLIDYYRNLYVLSVDAAGRELIDLPDEDVEVMLGLLSFYNSADINSILILLSRLYLDTKGSELARELFEIALIKLTRYKDIVHPASLVQRLEELKADLSTPAQMNPEGRDESTQKVKNSAAARGGQSDKGTVTATSEGDAGRSPGPVENADIAGTIIQHFSKKRMALAEFLKRAKMFSMENNLLTIIYEQREKLGYEHVHESSARRYIEKEIRNILQRDIRINVVIESDEEEKEGGEEYSEEVSKLMKIFKGEIMPER